MEGNMGKPKQRHPMDAMRQASATREARRPELEAAGLIAANDESTVVPEVLATTVEASKRLSKIKKDVWKPDLAGAKRNANFLEPRQTDP